MSSSGIMFLFVNLDREITNLRIKKNFDDNLQESVL